MFFGELSCVVILPVCIGLATHYANAAALHCNCTEFRTFCFQFPPHSLVYTFSISIQKLSSLAKLTPGTCNGSEAFSLFLMHCSQALQSGRLQLAFASMLTKDATQNSAAHSAPPAHPNMFIELLRSEQTLKIIGSNHHLTILPYL